MARLDMQKRMKTQDEFFDEHPEWRGPAMDIINVWGREEQTLNHAIAEALEHAWQQGRKGIRPEPPEPEAPRARMIRRPATTPAPPPTVIRRHRP